MRVIDPGHKYALAHLDDDGEEIVTYVKREGLKYPFNVGHYPGTNLQEGWRAAIHRLRYLDRQDPYDANRIIIEDLQRAILLLELRAAKRHRRGLPSGVIVRGRPSPSIELFQTCLKCGHIGCEGRCSK